jgi:phosphoesterase RecJ-like protein
MTEDILDFFHRHDSFILTTHDPADADGLGAELVFAYILENLRKKVRIINASPTPERFLFMDSSQKIESWDENTHGRAAENSSLLIADTSDEYNIGCMRGIIKKVQETFVADHHQPGQFTAFNGFLDSTASSTCEIAVETALAAGIKLDRATSLSAYAGIIYDTGSFAYIKTTGRTFKAALSLVEAGVVPYEVYGKLNESSSVGALLLEKQALSSLEIHCGGRVAVQILRKDDFERTGAAVEDAESFINTPLGVKEILVSLSIKENLEGKVRCSLRSKGTVNVSKIAQRFGGGGHFTAAGFRSGLSVEETLRQTLEKVENSLSEEI